MIIINHLGNPKSTLSRKEYNFPELFPSFFWVVFVLGMPDLVYFYILNLALTLNFFVCSFSLSRMHYGNRNLCVKLQYNTIYAMSLGKIVVRSHKTLVLHFIFITQYYLLTFMGAYSVATELVPSLMSLIVASAFNKTKFAYQKDKFYIQ